MASSIEKVCDSIVQEGLCVKPQHHEVRSPKLTDYAILRISSRLYLKLRYNQQTLSFQILLEKITFGRIDQVLSLTTQQYLTLLDNSQHILEAGEEEESLELGDHLYILLTNKFVIFKEFLVLQEENQLLQTLALNKEQFKKIVSFHPFLLTICPSLNKN